MKTDTVLGIMQIVALVGFMLSFGLALHTAYGIMGPGGPDMAGLDIPGMFSGDALTGYVPYEGADLSIEPSFSEQDLSTSALLSVDTKILDACSRTHRMSSDCYNIMKSIISVTSQGDPSHSSEMGRGLLPLRESQTDLSGSELQDPEQNLREASRYIMRLYDIYNGDLAFTSMAYIAGRGVSNSILYALHDDDVEEVTAGKMIYKLQHQYEELSSDLDLMDFEEISQTYVDILFAYHHWSGRTMADSTLEHMVFDHGTISVNPSFSTRMRYDIMSLAEMRADLASFMEAFHDDEVSFQRLLSFMISEYDENEYSYDQEALTFSIRNFTLRKGMCNPVLDDFNAIKDRLLQCIEMTESCYCDLTDLSFDHPGLHMHILVEEESHPTLDMENIVFRIEDDSGNTIKESKHISYLPGSRDLRIIIESVRGYPETILFDKSEDGWGTADDDAIFERHGGSSRNGELDPRLMISRDSEEVRIDKVHEGDLGATQECPISDEYEYVCMESDTAYVFDRILHKYVPMPHQFALPLDPLEFRSEHYDVSLDELPSKEIVISSEASEGEPDEAETGEETGPEERILSVDPGASCDELDSCHPEMILGKPAHYSNKRDRIVLHNLSYGSTEDALAHFRDNMGSSSRGPGLLPESHHGVHYIFEEGRPYMTKVAREDSVLAHLPFRDAGSIHIGIIYSSDSPGESLKVLLAERIAEIMIRNELDAAALVLVEEYEIPDFVPEENMPESYDTPSLDPESYEDVMALISRILVEYP